MADEDSIVTHQHLMTVESYIAEMAKNSAQSAVNYENLLKIMDTLSNSVNELVISERVRVEADKQSAKAIEQLSGFKEYAEPIVRQAEKDQAFWAGFIRNTVYAVSVALIIAVLSFSGKLVYDNAGKNNQQQTQKVGK